MAWGQGLLVCLHLIWAGVGMGYLCRRLGLGLLAQTIAGLAFGLSGYLVARAGFLSINSTAAWLPWIISYTPGFYPVDRRGLLKLSMIMSLQLLAGHAQTTWYTWMLAFGWAAFWGLGRSSLKLNGESHTHDKKSLPRFASGWPLRLGKVWGYLAISCCVAVVLAAVQILPTAEYLVQSQRAAAVDYEFAMTYSFWPWRFLSLIAPDLFGNPIQGDYWGYAAYWEDAIYIGVLPLLLAIAALVRKPRQKNHNALRWFLILIISVASLLGLGKNTPIYPWLYEHVPTFDLFQAPTRIMIWVVFALAILAGIGVDRWRRPESRALYWTRLGTAGAFAVAVGSGLSWYFQRDITSSFIRATAMAGFWGLGTGALALLAPPADAPENASTNPIRYWSLGVAFWVVVDLVSSGWGINPGIPTDVYRDSTPNAAFVQNLVEEHRIYVAPDDEETLKFDRFFRFDTFTIDESWRNVRAVLVPNLNLLEGISSANNFDPLVPGRYARWMSLLPELEARKRMQLLALMDVSGVQVMSENAALGVGFMSIENPSRVRWLSCAYTVMDGDSALSLLLRDDFDHDEVVVLETQNPHNQRECHPDSDAVIQIIRDNTNRLTINIKATESGWLLTSDVWYPGWGVVVDGEEADLRRADYLFRAVAISPGDHTVEFRYRPLSLYIGSGLSILGWLAVMVLFRNQRESRTRKHTNNGTGNE